MMRPSIGAGLVSLSCVLVASCSRGGPALAPVTGRVTYKGKPVANAAVSFTLESGGARIATGQTDNDGRFTLGTYAIGDGVTVGSHRVGVIARGPDRPARPGE